VLVVTERLSGLNLDVAIHALETMVRSMHTEIQAVVVINSTDYAFSEVRDAVLAVRDRANDAIELISMMRSEKMEQRLEKEMNGKE